MKDKIEINKEIKILKHNIIVCLRQLYMHIENNATDKYDLDFKIIENNINSIKKIIIQNGMINERL